jgi:hypothetical protein
LLIIEIFVLSLFYQSNGASIKKTTMNKLTILSTAISLGLIQQDHIILGILLVAATYFTVAVFLNAQNKK